LEKSEFYRIIDEVLPGGEYENAKNDPNRKIYFTRISLNGLEEMHAYSTDKRLYEFLELEPFKTIEDTRQYLKKLIDLEGDKILDRTAIGWFIRRIKDNRLIGTTRLVNINYKRQSVEWGYGIDPKLWGEGYIFEIQELLKEYIFEKLKLNRLSGIAMIENKRTISTLIATGCKEEGMLRQYYREHKGKYHDGWIYSMLAEEYFSDNTTTLNPENMKIITTEMIASIVENVLDQSNIDENDNMNSVSKWDSLSHINIILEIEKNTGYKFSPLNISQATSIKKIHELITSDRKH